MMRQALVILLVIVAFGILVPWYKGFAFLDPRITVAYGCIALLFVAPASAEAAQLAGEGATNAQLLQRLSLVVAYGWGITAVIFATALITLNVTYGRGTLIVPPVQLYGSVLVFSLAGAAMIAALSGVLSRRFSAITVKNIVRFAFLAALLAFAFSSRMPDAWQIWLADHSTRRAITRLAWNAAAVCGIAALGLSMALQRQPRAPGAPVPDAGGFAKIPMAENPHEEEDEQRR